MSMTSILPESRMNTTLRFLSNYVGPCGLAAFGFALWYYQASENIFTFIGWGALDLLLGINLLRKGSRDDAKLPLGYGIISMAVVAVIWKNGDWSWGFTETICASGAVASLIASVTRGPKEGAVFAALTMLVSGIPIAVDNFVHPHHWEWWLWVCSFVSSTLGLYLNYPCTRHNLADWVFVAVSETVGAAMLMILIIR